MAKEHPFWAVARGELTLPPCGQTLGWKLLEARPDGHVKIEFAAKQEFTNPVGNIQGGFLAAMLDDTIGPAISTMLEPDQFAPTLDSFRVTNAELAALGCGAPERLAVPGNTLVVADTFGFHARGASEGPSTRVEVWAIGRRSPFLSFESDRALQWLAGRRRVPAWQFREAGAFDRED